MDRCYIAPCCGASSWLAVDHGTVLENRPAQAVGGAPAAPSTRVLWTTQTQQLKRLAALGYFWGLEREIALNARHLR